MSWRDELLPATYGGVPFGVFSATSEFGRRFAVHNFPQRDEPYVEDLGETARTFRITGFVVGDDYHRNLRELRRVCTTRGPRFPAAVGRTLQHPYLGQFEAACTSFRVTQQSTAGRMARIELDFVETGDRRVAVRKANPVGEADEASAAIADQGEADALEAMTGAGSSEVRLATQRALQDLASHVRRLDVFTGPAAAVASVVRALDELVDQAVDLAQAPAVALATVRSAVGGLFRSTASLGAAFDSYRDLLSFRTSRLGTQGPTALRADGNAKALELLVRQLAIGEQVRAAVRMTWESRDQAQEARLGLSDAIDELADLSSPPVVVELQALRAAAARGVPPEDETLPVLRELVLPRTLAGLVLGYRLYGAPDRGEEIARRNGIRKPGFLPGGVALEVLSGE